MYRIFSILFLFGTTAVHAFYYASSNHHHCQRHEFRQRTVVLQPTLLYAAAAELPCHARIYRWEQGGKKVTPVTLDDDVAARATWNWCARFVAPHNLCPWAAASVQTLGAVAIYLIDSSATTSTTPDATTSIPTTTRSREKHHQRHQLESSSSHRRKGQSTSRTDIFATAVRDVSQIFHQTVSGPEPACDPHTAISFVVDVSDQWKHDFSAFNDYYEEILDDFMRQQQQDGEEEDSEYYYGTTADAVMWAPFHPAWNYGGLDADDPLHFEKQSPYPTISIVSQDILDQAGPQATQKIANTNEAILRQFNFKEWQRRYQEAVYGEDACWQ